MLQEQIEDLQSKESMLIMRIEEGEKVLKEEKSKLFAVRKAIKSLETLEEQLNGQTNIS